MGKETLSFYDLKQSSSPSHTLADQVVRELGQKIINGFYKPGDLLEDEGQLIERFKVSRTVLRDAVKVLAGKGLLEVRRGIGTRVRPRIEWAMLDQDVLAWQHQFTPKPEFLKQLIDVRWVIEPKAAMWASQRDDPEAKERIEQAYSQMEEEVDAVGAFVITDAQFHRAVLHASGNEILMAFDGVVCSAILSSIRLTNRTSKENLASLPLHRNVMQAILAKDATKAENEMEKLLSDSKSRLDKSFREFCS